MPKVLFLVLFCFVLEVWYTLKRLKNHHQEDEKSVPCVWKKALEEELPGHGRDTTMAGQPVLVAPGANVQHSHGIAGWLPSPSLS